ncbi:hypothetical protein FCM35_KLT11816 [Carex littledalei]|uniref:Uncharacterized protein n=1 Tax=Carex littledalei TaxID=544730 RepID=A0A833QRY2_9POAL|nr:hypothetical protein FCM35_KLT11816 [Carex littledalei]
MGMDVTGGEWAIVGGTGVSSCAQGVIHKKLLEKRCDRNIVELDIHFFYTLMQTGNCNMNQIEFSQTT